MSEALTQEVEEPNKDLKELVKREYKEGFVTEIESETFAPVSYTHLTLPTKA